jgi:hypothetical protein
VYFSSPFLKNPCRHDFVTQWRKPDVAAQTYTMRWNQAALFKRSVTAGVASGRQPVRSPVLASLARCARQARVVALLLKEPFPFVRQAGAISSQRFNGFWRTHEVYRQNPPSLHAEGNLICGLMITVLTVTAPGGRTGPGR